MKIFVISLKDSLSRREKISKIMKKLNITFEFFDAIDCRLGVPDKYENYIDRSKAILNQGCDLGNAEYGCSLSHALVYEKILNEGIEHSVILEDDVIIDDDFAVLISNNYLEKTDAKGVLLYHLFASTIMPTVKQLFGAYKIHSLAKTPLSTAGYYITYDLAEKIYEKSFPIYTQADWVCDIVNMGMKAIVPRIVQHPPIENSTIEKSRTVRKQIFGKYGFVAWIKYKGLKPFSKKISKTIEGE